MVPHSKPLVVGLFMIIAISAMLLLGCASQTTPKDSPTATPKAAAAPRVVYIAHATDPVVSVFDLDKREMKTSLTFNVPGGNQQGHFVSVTQDGKRLWIAEDMSNTTGFVQVVDLATGAQLQRWDVGAGVGNYLTRDGKFLFTSSTKTKNINVFDVANTKYLGEFPIAAAPHVLDSSPDGKTLWTTDADGNLRSFDISGLPDRLPTPVDTIKIGGSLHAVLAHPNGKYVFVGSSESGDNVVDVTTKSIVAKVAGKPHNYEISPDRKYLVVGSTEFATCDELKDFHASPGQHSESKGPLLRMVNIATLDAKTTPDFSTVKTERWLDFTSQGPASVSHHKYDSTGKLLLVTAYRHKDASSRGEGALLVVDAATLQVQATFDVPARPHALAIPGNTR